MAGQAVRTISLGGLAPTVHRVLWDGRDDHGRPVSTGMYLYHYTNLSQGGSAGFYYSQ